MRSFHGLEPNCAAKNPAGNTWPSANLDFRRRFAKIWSRGRATGAGETGSGDIDELWERRAGRREANLRALNDRIVQALEGTDGDMHIVCECALRDCTEELDVPVEVFDEVREHEQRFLIVPGHLFREVEREVGRGETWAVVEKYGAAAEGVREESHA